MAEKSGLITPNAKSKAYLDKVGEWTKVEAVMGGDSAIKKAGKIFCPKLSGQNDTEYDAYLNRGCFFNAFKRTVFGLTGAVIQKEPQIKCHPSVDALLPNITLDGESIQEVIRIVIQNEIEYGYYGILVDAPEMQEGVAATGNPVPYFALYNAPAILNPITKQIGDEKKLVKLSLAETLEVQTADPFVMETKERVRVLEIIDGVLVVRLYEKNLIGKKEVWNQVGTDIYPKIRGANWTEIPFIFFGSISNKPDPDDPPLIDLANLNIKHWQVSVDYYHGIHYCSLPTPWAAGFPLTSSLYIGAQKAWISEDANAKCGFMEFTGQGLQPVENALTRLENQMAVMGSRLLEDQKKAAEAADTVRMRFSGDTATLSSIVNSAEQGVIKAINYLARWLNLEEKAEVKLNRLFVSERLSPQDITALLGAWQQGSISWDTFLYNLQVGEVLPADRTIEQEKALAEAQKPFKEASSPMFDENNLGGDSNPGEKTDIPKKGKKVVPSEEE